MNLLVLPPDGRRPGGYVACEAREDRQIWGALMIKFRAAPAIAYGLLVSCCCCRLCLLSTVAAGWVG